MRRRVGVGAVQKQQLAQARFKDKGQEIAENQVQHLSQQMEAFRTKLQDFAAKHNNKIRKNPEFRQQFQDMCATVGVDPLASSKGFWAKLLGVGDFYYELGVQIIEVCIATRHRNGGIMNIEELQSLVIKSRGTLKDVISRDDLIRAVEKLKALGEGFRIIPTARGFLVQSVASELTMDHTSILQLAQTSGSVSVTSIRQSLGWSEERTIKALEDLIKEGFAWVDDQCSERTFWFPGLLQN